jgi:hypothetical protein
MLRAVSSSETVRRRLHERCQKKVTQKAATLGPIAFLRHGEQSKQSIISDDAFHRKSMFVLKSRFLDRR